VSTLELNIKAKKHIPVPQEKPVPVHQSDGLVLETGKKYVLNNGTVITLGGKAHHYGTDKKTLHFTLGTGWHDDDGVYTSFPKEHPKSIAREWISEEHDAWLAGKKIQYNQGDGIWHTAYAEKILREVFGETSSSYKTWWKTHYQNEKRNARIAP
jgi:hypothetical protein